jgi:hypothetical protein
MTWQLRDRHGQYLGSFERLEAAMCVLGTGEIGVEWQAINQDQYIGVSNGGAIRFVLNKQTPEGD